ncbi:stage V sporulation protein AD [Anoxybacter fermentans]|uniref:Stage V sporulation protein AD n=1 Tax=Anoxybacter fermentans TaxID=1323375 RepID=A0A3S9SVL7_9FIRM|nr:stage V sporulation protein AD [Anoxybacter fermentans]AZR72312.1 stage V sporulation protein AD [Anoxybacter fermentans]
MKRTGKTIYFDSPPVITATSAIAGEMEGKGPLKDYFDKIVGDAYYDTQTFEKAERKICGENCQNLLKKANLKPEQVDFLLAGDLLNQIVTANFCARELKIPFIGLYGACSTLIEALAVGCMVIDGGFAQNIMAFASSHYQTAERQYRMPNEYGIQYPPYKQWTVTGSGAFILSKGGSGPRITHATIGRVIDFGIKDPNDMGAAMAPAAADTIIQHLSDLNRSPDDYDLIVTGDLGEVGKTLARELLREKNYDVDAILDDCGVMLYNDDQKTGAKGSGAAASAIVLASYLYQKLNQGEFNRIMIVGTGALLSPITALQGDSIPSIAHGITIEKPV